MPVIPDQTAAPDSENDPIVCPEHHTAHCLAVIRAEVPPVGLLDFLDRQVKLLCSDHWDSKCTRALLAVLVKCTFLTALLTLMLTQITTPAWLMALLTGVALGCSQLRAGGCLPGSRRQSEWRRSARTDVAGIERPSRLYRR